MLKKATYPVKIQIMTDKFDDSTLYKKSDESPFAESLLISETVHTNVRKQFPKQKLQKGM